MIYFPFISISASPLPSYPGCHSLMLKFTETAVLFTVTVRVLPCDGLWQEERGHRRAAVEARRHGRCRRRFLPSGRQGWPAARGVFLHFRFSYCRGFCLTGHWAASSLLFCARVLRAARVARAWSMMAFTWSMNSA